MQRNHWERGLWENRRGLLRWAGLLFVGGFPTRVVEGAKATKPEFAGLGENDRLTVDVPAAEIVERAYRLGRDYEARHGGCCRCTVAALQDAIASVPKDLGLFRAASCLDGGATPTAVQNCGSFTGAGMFVGWMCRVESFGNTGLSHRLIREVFEHFKKEYGSVLCKDVRKGANGKCPEVVGRAARWTAEVLLHQFGDFRGDVHAIVSEASHGLAS